MGHRADLFLKINNAVLDLQASQLQTYERPLKVLAGILRDPTFEEINKKLIDKVDFESFIAESAKTGGGMVGSHRLVWPEDQDQVLGLTLLLIEKFASDDDFAFNFCHKYYHAGEYIISWIHAMVRQLIIPFVRDYKDYVMTSVGVVSAREVPQSNKVFIVHGHDVGARESVARFVQSLSFVPIILHEQANRGRTIIEKVYGNSDVGFAIVLLTPDDEGRIKGGELLRPRARQNVLIELGYFIGLLGRENVCALKRGEVETPSDFDGVVWTTMDENGAWKQELGRELEAAGHAVDWNKVMRP